MKAIVVGLVLAVATLTVPASAEPGAPEGWLSVAVGETAPGVTLAVPYTLTHVASVDGHWFAAGNWHFTLKRGCQPPGFTTCSQTFEYDSAQFPPAGVTQQLTPTAGKWPIQKGDRMWGTWRAIGTTMGFGTFTGCTEMVRCDKDL